MFERRSKWMTKWWIMREEKQQTHRRHRQNHDEQPNIIEITIFKIGTETVKVYQYCSQCA